jgi:hypothetical protein
MADRKVSNQKPIPAGVNPDTFNPMPTTQDGGYKGQLQNQQPYPGVGAVGESMPLDPSQVTKEYGQTGTIIVSGILTGNDYVPELTGTQRILKFDEMRKGDATVRAAMQAIKLPLQGAQWYIDAPKGMEEDDPMVEFVKRALFDNLEYPWHDFFRHALLYLDYGSMIFEKVFKVGDDGMIYWKYFSPRLPTTIYRWTLSDGVTPGITQILPVGGLRQIPDWKLLRFTNEQEGLNFEGISLLRAAYKHYYYKNVYYEIDAIAQERQGLGVPIVHVPPNASSDDRNRAEEMMRNLRVNEWAHLQLPIGFEIEFLDMKAGAIKNPKDMIAHHDRQILMAVLAQFLHLGSSNVGSFALSSNQSELFLQSLNAIANHIREVINEAIRELVDLNFNTKVYPTLEVTRIGQVDVKLMSESLWRLAAAGLIVPDNEIEQYVRNMLDLPEAMQNSANNNSDPTGFKYDTQTLQLMKLLSQSVDVGVKDLMIAIRDKKLETVQLEGQNDTATKNTTDTGATKADDSLKEVMKLREEVRKIVHDSR